MVVAVFLHDPGLSADDVVAVFAAAGFRTAVDARGAAIRAQGGVLVDDADPDSARRLVDALAHRGHEAAVVDVDRLGLPAAVRTKELVLTEHGIEFADSLGRLRPLPDVVLLAAARARVVSSEAAPGRQQGPSAAARVMSTAASIALPGARTLAKAATALGGGGRPPPSTALVETEQTFVDVVTATSRLRLDDSGVVLRAGGPRSLAELCARINERAPSTTTRQRGFLALIAHAQPPLLKSLREFDREVAWAWWRSKASSSSSSS